MTRGNWSCGDDVNGDFETQTAKDLQQESVSYRVGDGKGRPDYTSHRCALLLRSLGVVPTVGTVSQ